MRRARDARLIKRAMADRDLSYRELACHARIGVSTCQNYVEGRRPLDPALARRIARFLRQPVDLLFAVEASTSAHLDDQRKASA